MASRNDSSPVSLRQERLNRGLTLREAAAEIGVSVAALQRAEHDHSLSPSNSKAIADFYGRQVGEIWPVEDRESTSTTKAAA